MAVPVRCLQILINMSTLFDNVEVPMLLENMMLSEITAAREGTTVTLQCSPVMTDPAPMITWLVDGIVDPQTTESFTTATVNESAIYQCLVEASFTPSTNRVGLPPSTSIISSTLVDCKSCVYTSGVILQCDLSAHYIPHQFT